MQQQQLVQQQHLQQEQQILLALTDELKLQKQLVYVADLKERLG